MLQRAEAGVPFHRMAALYRRQDPYVFQLRMELGFAGIPVAGPDPSPLRASVPGRLLTGMLDVIREDFSRAGPDAMAGGRTGVERREQPVSFQRATALGGPVAARRASCAAWSSGRSGSSA